MTKTLNMAMSARFTTGGKVPIALSIYDQTKTS